MSEVTIQLMWRLARTEELRTRGSAAIEDWWGTEAARALFDRLAGEILALMQPGDELWSWQPAEDWIPSGRAGLAVLRGDEVIRAW